MTIKEGEIVTDDDINEETDESEEFSNDPKFPHTQSRY